MDAFLTSDGILALVTLTFLEIVLGVDNVIFISICPASCRRISNSRRAHELLAAMRILLLMSIA
jgi:predicted tellurium resistance membrane protein TerC